MTRFILVFIAFFSFAGLANSAQIVSVYNSQALAQTACRSTSFWANASIGCQLNYSNTPTGVYVNYPGVSYNPYVTVTSTDSYIYAYYDTPYKDGAVYGSQTAHVSSTGVITFTSSVDSAVKASCVAKGYWFHGLECSVPPSTANLVQTAVAVLGLGFIGLVTAGVGAIGVAAFLAAGSHVAVVGISSYTPSPTSVVGASTNGKQVFQVALASSTNKIKGVPSADFDATTKTFKPNANGSLTGTWVAQPSGGFISHQPATISTPAASASISADGKTFITDTPVSGGYKTLQVFADTTDNQFYVTESAPIAFSNSTGASASGVAVGVRSSILDTSGNVVGSGVYTTGGGASEAPKIGAVMISGLGSGTVGGLTGGSSTSAPSGYTYTKPELGNPVSTAPATNVTFPPDYARQGESQTAALTVKSSVDTLTATFNDNGAGTDMVDNSSTISTNPITTYFNPLKNWTPPPLVGTCPIGSFSWNGHNFGLDAICTLFEQQRPIISAAFNVFYVLTAMMIVLGA